MSLAIATGLVLFAAPLLQGESLARPSPCSVREAQRQPLEPQRMQGATQSQCQQHVYWEQGCPCASVRYWVLHLTARQKSKSWKASCGDVTKHKKPGLLLFPSSHLTLQTGVISQVPTPLHKSHMKKTFSFLATAISLCQMNHRLKKISQAQLRGIATEPSKHLGSSGVSVLNLSSVSSSAQVPMKGQWQLSFPHELVDTEAVNVCWWPCLPK